MIKFRTGGWNKKPHFHEVKDKMDGEILVDVCPVCKAISPTEYYKGDEPPCIITSKGISLKDAKEITERIYGGHCFLWYEAKAYPKDLKKEI